MARPVVGTHVGGFELETGEGRFRLAPLLVFALAVVAALASQPPATAGEGSCASRAPVPARTTAVLRSALDSGRDVLGERFLASPAGPTYGGVRGVLPSLWYARGRGGGAVTRSGAYYLTFGYPGSLYGEKAFGLHVADGSEILVSRTDGPALRVVVGRRPELYGSCLSRLGGPQLADGWLPILRTTYVDADGVRYAQESFVGRLPGVAPVVSLVRLTVDARPSGRPALVRFAASPGGRRLLVPGRAACSRGASCATESPRRR